MSGITKTPLRDVKTSSVAARSSVKVSAHPSKTLPADVTLSKPLAAQATHVAAPAVGVPSRNDVEYIDLADDDEVTYLLIPCTHTSVFVQVRAK